MNRKVVIIGGGINGLLTAYYLQKENIHVTIIDRSDLQDGCSFGNAGYISPSHIIPLAAPGVISKSLKWLINPESPFYIKPRLKMDLVSWIYTFLKKANKKHVEYSIPHMKDFLLYSKDLYKSLVEENNFQTDLIEDGILMAFNTDHGQDEELALAEIANSVGIKANIWSLEEIIKVIPTDSTSITGAVHYPQDAHINPANFMQNLYSYLSSCSNVKFKLNKEIMGLETNGNMVTGIRMPNETIETENVVITSGIWSSEILKTADINIPMQGGKGYHIEFETGRNNFILPMILVEGKVAITPFETRLRIAGTMEITDLNENINQSRIRGIENSMRNFFPDFMLPKDEKKVLWSGFRPCSPDGLPYVGRVKNYKNLLISTGHCMLGISLGAASGKIISDLVCEKKPEIEYIPFAPDRFN